MIDYLMRLQICHNSFDIWKPKPKKRFQDTDGTPPLRGENDISTQLILAYFSIITVRNALA